MTGNRHSSPVPPAPAAVTWLGHATVLIELDGVRVLTDPVIRQGVGPLVRITDGVDRARLVGLDAILLSHLHADHADPRSLRQLGRKISIVAPAGSGRWLQRRGMMAVNELAAGERLTVAGLEVRATPAVHDARRWPWGHAAPPVGYVVRGSRSIYFAGDTDLFPQLGDMRGTVDAALLPIWGWGRTLGEGHLDPERAARAAAMIAPALVIPIHWGTFALRRPGGRPPDPGLPASEFLQFVTRYAPDVEVRLLAPGDRTQL